MGIEVVDCNRALNRKSKQPFVVLPSFRMSLCWWMENDICWMMMMTVATSMKRMLGVEPELASVGFVVRIDCEMLRCVVLGR